jgi:uncharacterized protein YfaS (alpha-2-macroglobulin family)
VRVHDPIVVTPTVPRFVSTNDTFSIPVTVRNDTPRNGTFEITAKITGNTSLPTQPRVSCDLMGQGGGGHWLVTLAGAVR